MEIVYVFISKNLKKQKKICKRRILSLTLKLEFWESMRVAWVVVVASAEWAAMVGVMQLVQEYFVAVLFLLSYKSLEYFDSSA
jgi:hypothetical protein